MEKITRKPNMKNVRIPIIVINKLLIIGNKNRLECFYGIDNIKNEKKAIDTIKSFINQHELLKSVIFYDFRTETTHCGKKWNVMYDFNTYTNTESTEATSLINSKTGWERVFWFVSERGQEIISLINKKV